MTPRLSVVIPVYDNWWLTARALRALDALRESAPAFEAIVVDNASTDETPERIRDFAWVRYERLEANTNFAGGCNTGARLAQAPIVLFLNNDALPLGDAFSPLIGAFERLEVAVAGGALFFEDGVTQCAGFVMLPNAHWHYSCRNLPSGLDGVTHSRDALGVSGAAMAVRKQWFLDIGGFDENFVNGFEDVDLCMRARDQGRVIAYVADARFAHYEAASARRYAREAENEARFYERWASRLASLPRAARGAVRAIAMHARATMPPLQAAALHDLEVALRSFGHPLVRGNVRPWQRLDARFRTSATLEWFASASESPGVSIAGDGSALAQIRTRGAVELRVPWLPCADAERVASLPLRLSADPACETIVVAGLDAASAERKADVAAALETLVHRRNARVLSFEEDVWARQAPQAIEVACVVHVGLTDPAAFGNILLAQSELPSVVIGDDLRALFADDVALFAEGDGGAAIERLLGNVAARVHYARVGSADARRRFSPRRTAIRVVDLLCAARFGLERPAPARSNSPLTR